MREILPDLEMKWSIPLQTGPSWSDLVEMAKVDMSWHSERNCLAEVPTEYTTSIEEQPDEVRSSFGTFARRLPQRLTSIRSAAVDTTTISTTLYYPRPAKVVTFWHSHPTASTAAAASIHSATPTAPICPPSNSTATTSSPTLLSAICLTSK